MRGYEREQTRKDLMDHRLADSLKVLIRQEPLEKITIKQITDDAGVVRPTFYQHFADKYRLVEWILQKDGRVGGRTDGRSEVFTELL